MQQINCMFCSNAHVLFKKQAFALINAFEGSNNVQKHPPHISLSSLCHAFPSLFILKKITHSASLGNFCTENVLLLHQRSLIGVFFSANTDLTAFFVGAIFAAFYADALFLKGGLQ